MFEIGCSLNVSDFFKHKKDKKKIIQSPVVWLAELVEYITSVTNTSVKIVLP